MTANNTQVPPINDKKVRSLIVKLTTGSPKRQSAAAEALAEIGDPRAVPILVLVSEDRSVRRDVRSDASNSLGDIRNPSAVPALMEALDDVVVGSLTRRMIIRALEAIGDPQAAPSLILRLNDKDIDVRLRAAVALGTWKSNAAVPALIAALKDRTSATKYDAEGDGLEGVDQYVCDEAATALGRIGDARAVPALSEAWRGGRHYGHTHARAIEALGEIGGPLAARSLIEALDNAEYRKGAVKALAMIGPSASPAIIEALGRKRNRSLMISVLIKILRSDGHLLPRYRAAELLKVIAAHQPDPALRAALPILRRNHRSHSLLLRDSVFKEAMEQIEAATAVSRRLPLPAAAPPPDVGTLPRPAAAAPRGALGTPAPQGFWTRLRRRLKSS